eukprot:9434220-Pyramimonas_sp.AAC.1
MGSQYPETSARGHSSRQCHAAPRRSRSRCAAQSGFGFGHLHSALSDTSSARCASLCRPRAPCGQRLRARPPARPGPAPRREFSARARASFLERRQ